MLRIDWDPQTTPFIDNTCYLTIRTGRSRAYRNVLNGIAVRDPARAARIRQEMDALLLLVPAVVLPEFHFSSVTRF